MSWIRDVTQLVAIVGVALSAACAQPPTDEAALSGSDEALILSAAEFSVAKINFKDFGGEWVAGSKTSAVHWDLAAIESTVHAYVELSRGSIPSSFTPTDLELKVDGYPVEAGWGPAKNGRIYLFVDLTRLGKPSPTRVISGRVLGMRSAWKIQITGVTLEPVSTFAAMNDTFDHVRCKTCHSLGNSKVWADFHKSFGVNNGYTNHPENVDVNDNGICQTCHGAVEDWRAPPFSKNMDWTKITTASERCETVRDHLPSMFAKLNHFYEDPRLQWAYYDGVLQCAGGDGSFLDPGPIPNPERFLDAVTQWSLTPINGSELGHCEGLDIPRPKATW